jgi:hypothetical protein
MHAYLHSLCYVSHMLPHVSPAVDATMTHWDTSVELGHEGGPKVSRVAAVMHYVHVHARKHRSTHLKVRP